MRKLATFATLLVCPTIVSCVLTEGEDLENIETAGSSAQAPGSTILGNSVLSGRRPMISWSANDSVVYAYRLRVGTNDWADRYGNSGNVAPSTTSFTVQSDLPMDGSEVEVTLEVATDQGWGNWVTVDARVFVSSGEAPPSPPPPPESVFHESFGNADLETRGWQWRHEQPQGWRIASGDGLEILSTPGRTIYKGRRGNYSPNTLIRPIDHNCGVDFAVTARVTSGLYDQGGLVLYNDNDNYIKLVIERITPERRTLIIALREDRRQVNHRHHELGDDPGDDEIKIEVPGDGQATTYEFDLRLRLQNGQVTIYWRPLRASWKRIGETMPLPSRNGQWYAGLLTSGGSSNKRWQRYRGFSLTQGECE